MAEGGLVKLLGFPVCLLVEHSLFFLFTVKKRRVWDFCAFPTPLDGRCAIFSSLLSRNSVNNEFSLQAIIRIMNWARIFIQFIT